MYIHQLVEETTSTNALLMERAKMLAASGKSFPKIWALQTQYQTHGRGAGNNKWFSGYGDNILMSVCVKPQLATADQFLFSVLFSLATRRFLSKYLQNVKIKWPNDIYVDDKKIAGILIEHSLSGNNINFSIAGIGLNVNAAEFPDDIPNPTSLFIETGGKYNVSDLSVEFLEVFEKMLPLLDMSNEGLLRKEYIEHLYRFGEKRRFVAGGRSFQGIIRDIDKFGRIVIENASKGGLMSFEYKQIAYVI